MIYHVNVQISNRQQTQEWYEQMLGAEFLDRGRINPRQLQLRSGTGEMHFTETSEPVATGYFAVEIDDWDGNVIELVYHPLGLEDVEGKRVELPDTSKRLRWKQKDGFVNAG